MSKEEIKYEISKVLDKFSEQALVELLAFVKQFGKNQKSKSFLDSSLSKIPAEDKELLRKLAWGN